MPVFQFTSRLLALPPRSRRVLLVLADALLVPLAVWLSFAIRLAQPWPDQLQHCLWILPAALVLSLGVYVYTGQYKGITRYSGSRSLYALALRNALVVVLLAAVEWLAGWPAPPRSSWLLLWILLTGFTGLVRLLLRDLLLAFTVIDRQCRPVLIYGAGAAGAQLAASLRIARSHRVVGFLDDNIDLWGRQLDGARVDAPRRLPELISRYHPSEVLLAIPSLSRSRRRQIVEDVQAFEVTVLQVPSFEEITSGRARIDDMRPIAIEELLGRDAVTPDSELLGATVRGRCVLVSGAGGSIGSELCRQILTLAPRRLILLEQHEPSLYAIDKELCRALASLAATGTGSLPLVQPVLGSVLDVAQLQQLFAGATRRGDPIQVVFHAAAYKHVPMVEVNPVAGLANNVLGTQRLTSVCARYRVEHVLVISTDKAVRPTNVMGASKRLAELVVQAMAQEADATRFALVRFGNVLGSSGSVVPLFREQIAAGGPITLTHPDVVRYFMTIPEAVQLVLQASALASGGDLFLLDMGEPVKIVDLARQMVRLSGHSLRTPGNPTGDIEIRCIGLRPGEKLYEELLIDAESSPTSHPLIYKAIEASFSPQQLWPRLAVLEAALTAQDEQAALALLAELVPEWQQQPTDSETPAEVVRLC